MPCLFRGCFCNSVVRYLLKIFIRVVFFLLLMKTQIIRFIVSNRTFSLLLIYFMCVSGFFCLHFTMFIFFVFFQFVCFVFRFYYSFDGVAISSATTPIQKRMNKKYRRRNGIRNFHLPISNVRHCAYVSFIFAPFVFIF